MKFEKPPNSASTALSAEQIALANRFEERRAKIEAARNGPTNPEMRRRVLGMLQDLAAELEAKSAPSRSKRWRGDGPKAMTLEEMTAKWRDDPVMLSPVLAEKMDGV